MSSVACQERIFVRTIFFPKRDFDANPLVFCEIIRNNRELRHLQRGDVILVQKVHCTFLRVMRHADSYVSSFSRGDCKAWISQYHVIAKIAEKDCIHQLAQINSLI